MITIGLTGGIGMGKSTTAEMLLQRGLPVSDSDVIAHELVEPGKPALAEIAKHFGPEMIGPDGRLRRDLLARCVFASVKRRRELEAILHPRIRKEWMARAARWRQSGLPRGVVVIPLLYETLAAADCDRVICVACTPSTQRARLLARGWSDDEIRRRCLAQWPIERKMSLAHFVIWSEGGLDVLAAQLDRVLAQI